MKNRIREVALLSALAAFAGLPALAQDVDGTLAVSMPAAPAASPAAFPAPPPPSWGVPEGRLFFPHNWVRGHVDFEVAPPHNEPDLGRCGPEGANTQCTAFARYMVSGYVELQPFGRTPLRHLFFFGIPRASFGNNVPQFRYTGSFAPIAIEQSLGFGFDLPGNFEFRATQHQVDWLGKYRGYLGPSDLGTTGPYGMYATLGIRWYFGGYGRSGTP